MLGKKVQCDRLGLGKGTVWKMRGGKRYSVVDYGWEKVLFDRLWLGKGIV